MTDRSTERRVDFDISEETAAVLARAGKKADVLARQAVMTWVKIQLEEEEKDRLEKAGLYYVARYWQYGRLREEQFFTVREAESFLETIADESSGSSVGVFDSLGNKCEGETV